MSCVDLNPFIFAIFFSKRWQPDLITFFDLAVKTQVGVNNCTKMSGLSSRLNFTGV